MRKTQTFHPDCKGDMNFDKAPSSFFRASQDSCSFSSSSATKLSILMLSDFDRFIVENGMLHVRAILEMLQKGPEGRGRQNNSLHSVSVRKNT